MKKKSAASFIGALAILCAGGGTLAACGDATLNLPPFDYDYSKPVEDFGDGVKIDGKLDEEVWKNVKTFSTTIRNTNVIYRMTSCFGEKGAYFAFDIDDDAVYFNSEREIYNNSGIEFCVGSPLDTRLTYEIDLNAGGKRMLRKYTGAPYTNWFSELHSAIATKGGDVNTSECTGYTAEIYLPYALFNPDGSDTPLETLLVNPSIIRANSNRPTSSEDRLWYNIGGEERGLGYAPAALNWYGFGGEGLVCDSVTIVNSAGGVVSGKDYVIKDDTYVLDIAPDAGYYLEKLTVNGKEVTDGISYTEGKAVYKFTGGGDAEIKAQFAPLSEAKFTVSGTVSTADGGEAGAVTLFAAYGGTVTPIAVNNGAFTAALPEAEYELYCSADGYLTNVERVSLFGDVQKNLTLRKSFLGTHEVIGAASNPESWDLSLLGQGTAISKDNGWLVAANHTTLMGTKMFVSGNIVLPMREGSDRRAGFRFVDRSGNGVFVCLIAENEKSQNKYGMQIIGLGSNLWTGRDLDDATVRPLADGTGVPFAALYENGETTVWVNGVKIVDRFKDGVPLTETSEVVPGIVTCSGGEFRNLVFNTTGYENGYPVTISTTGRGTVTCDKQIYQAGETLTFTVTPRDGYAVSAITVNGKDVFSTLSGNTFTVETGNLTSVFVNVSFIPVSGEKGTLSGTIVCGGSPVTGEISLTLSNKATGTELKLKATDGTFTFDDLDAGVWELIADGAGYLDYKQIINVSGTEKIEIQLTAVTMHDKWVVDGGEMYNVDEIEDGKIVYTGTEGEGTQSFGVTLNIQAKENEDIYVSAIIRNQSTFAITNDGRYGFKFVGAGRALNCDYAYWGVHNVTLVDWGVFNDQAAQLSEKQVAAWNGAGLRIAAARIGGKFYMFAEEDGVMKMMTSAEHSILSNAVINVGFETWWQAKGAEYTGFEYKVGSIPLDVVKRGGENGTVEVSANPVLGGNVTVTLTPDSGYTISSVTVNGENKTSSLVTSGGSSVLMLANYTGSKNLVIESAFVEKAEVNVALDIKLHRYGIGTNNLLSIPDGVSVVLRGVNTYEGVSANGSVTFGEVAKGSYTLEAAGYVALPVEVTAAVDEEVTLEYDLIGSTADIDTTDANNGNVSLNINSNGEVLFKQEIKATEDFYVSAIFKNVDKDADSLRFGFWIGRDNNDDGNITGIWGDNAETGEQGERIYAPLCYQWYEDVNTPRERQYVMQFIPGWNGYFLDDASATAMDGGAGVRLGLARVNGTFYMLRELNGEIKIVAQFNDTSYAGRFAEQNIRVGIATMGAETAQKVNFNELQLEAVQKGTAFGNEKVAKAFTKLNVMAVTDSGTGFKSCEYHGQILADALQFSGQNGKLSWATPSSEIVYFKNNMTNLTLDFTVKATIPANGRVTAFAVYTGMGPFVCDITNISDDNYTLRIERHWDDWNDGVSMSAKQLEALKTTGIRMRIVRTDLTFEWYVDTCEGAAENLQLAISRNFGDGTSYTFGATGCGIGVSGSAAEFTGITLSGVS